MVNHNLAFCVAGGVMVRAKILYLDSRTSAANSVANTIWLGSFSENTNNQNISSVTSKIPK